MSLENTPSTVTSGLSSLTHAIQHSYRCGDYENAVAGKVCVAIISLRMLHGLHFMIDIIICID